MSDWQPIRVPLVRIEAQGWGRKVSLEFSLEFCEEFRRDWLKGRGSITADKWDVIRGRRGSSCCGGCKSDCESAVLKNPAKNIQLQLHPTPIPKTWQTLSQFELLTAVSLKLGKIHPIPVPRDMSTKGG